LPEEIEDGNWDYAMDEDEGQFQHRTEAETIFQRIQEKRLQQSLQLFSGPGNVIKITSKPNAVEALHYLSSILARQ
jgi:hypothetical protein